MSLATPIWRRAEALAAKKDPLAADLLDIGDRIAIGNITIGSNWEDATAIIGNLGYQHPATLALEATTIAPSMEWHKN